MRLSKSFCSKNYFCLFFLAFVTFLILIQYHPHFELLLRLRLCLSLPSCLFFSFSSCSWPVDVLKLHLQQTESLTHQSRRRTLLGHSLA
jgi:hypothetical protein